MGKAAFVHLSDGISRLQIYIRKADVTGVARNSAEGGDVDGWELFLLRTALSALRLSVRHQTGGSRYVQKLQFLSKALLPLPDKMHGILIRRSGNANVTPI